MGILEARRAMDLILRLSKSTTEDLSVFVSFRSLRRLKIAILEDSIGVVQTFLEHCVFDPLFCSEDHSRTF